MERKKTISIDRVGGSGVSEIGFGLINGLAVEGVANAGGNNKKGSGNKVVE